MAGVGIGRQDGVRSCLVRTNRLAVREAPWLAVPEVPSGWGILIVRPDALRPAAAGLNAAVEVEDFDLVVESHPCLSLLPRSARVALIFLSCTRRAEPRKRVTPRFSCGLCALRVSQLRQFVANLPRALAMQDAHTRLPCRLRCDPLGSARSSRSTIRRLHVTLGGTRSSSHT